MIAHDREQDMIARPPYHIGETVEIKESILHEFKGFQAHCPQRRRSYYMRLDQGIRGARLPEWRGRHALFWH